MQSLVEICLLLLWSSILFWLCFV